MTYASSTAFLWYRFISSPLQPSSAIEKFPLLFFEPNLRDALKQTFIFYSGDLFLLSCHNNLMRGCEIESPHQHPYCIFSAATRTTWGQSKQFTSRMRSQSQMRNDVYIMIHFTIWISSNPSQH